MNLPAYEDAEATSPRPGSATIVIGCYNHARFVEQCLDSAFAQTHEDLRVIVFDDASQDNSQQVIRDYLARTGHEDVTFLAHEQNRGLCASLNEVRALIDTEFVAFISADDWMEPERFEVQIAELDRRGTEYGVVYSDMHRVDQSGNPLEGSYFDKVLAQYPGQDAPPQGNVFNDMVLRQVFATPAMLSRTSTLIAAGPYDEGLRFEDYDMILRLARSTGFAYVDRPLVSYRDTPGSMFDTLYEDLPRLCAEFGLIYRKHLTGDHLTDLPIVWQIGSYAKAGYLAGADPSSVAVDLALVAQETPSVPNWFYAQASKLGVPGRWLNGGVVVARKLKLRVRSLRKRDD